MEIYRELTSGKKPTCNWFASFLVKSELIFDIPKTGLSVGVDVDIKSFLALSNFYKNYLEFVSSQLKS